MPLLRGRRAELVVEWQIDRDSKDLEHDIYVRNDGRAPARDLELKLLRGGTDVTSEYFNSPVKLRSLAPRNKAAGIIMTFWNDTPGPDEIAVSWSDRRWRRQHMKTALQPVE